MNRKQLLDHFNNEAYCRIGVSKIHGVGVIAIKDIPKGVDPFSRSFNGEYIRVTDGELEDVNEEIKKIINDFFFYENGSYFIPENGLNAIDISFYLNHSDDPNLMALDDYERFITKRAVKKGEELTFQYPSNKSL